MWATKININKFFDSFLEINIKTIDSKYMDLFQNRRHEKMHDLRK